jgi:hypothetical protein
MRDGALYGQDQIPCISLPLRSLRHSINPNHIGISCSVVGNLEPITLSAYRLPTNTTGFVTQKHIPTTLVIVWNLSMLLMSIASKSY